MFYVARDSRTYNHSGMWKAGIYPRGVRLPRYSVSVSLVTRSLMYSEAGATHRVTWLLLKIGILAIQSYTVRVSSLANHVSQIHDEIQ